MLFLDKRASIICDELKSLRICQRRVVEGLRYKPGAFIHPEEARADETPFAPFDTQTMHWYGPDRHYWFEADVTVPDSFDGRPLWLCVHTQIDGWDARNPQFLVFIDGQVAQGLDTNHREVLLTRSARAGERYHIDLQAYTGTDHAEFRLVAELQEIDPEINGLYWDLYVPLSAFSRLEEDGKSRRDLTRVINDAVNLLDLRTPYSDDFYRSVHAARAFLRLHLYEELAGHDDVPVIFAHQLHQRGNELQNVLLGSVAGRGGHRCTSSFLRGQLPQNVASLTPQGQITAFLFSVQSRQGKNNKDSQNDQCNCILCHLDTS